MDENALRKLIEKNNFKHCFKHLIALPHEERRRLSKTSIKLLKETSELRYKPDGHRLDWETAQKREASAQACVYVTCTLAEIKKLGWLARPEFELAEFLIIELKPDWLNEWIYWLIEFNPHNYRLIRYLFDKGLCQKPEHDHFILGMILHFGRNKMRDSTRLIETLLQEKDLLETDIWRLFEVEGNGEFSLAAHDKYTSDAHNWSIALVELANRDEPTRNRLLDASLDALGRDFLQFRAGWYSRFHEALNPTLEERKARTDSYLSLLGSQIAPTVTLALKALSLIHKSGDLDSNKFIASALPALESKLKATALLGLRILESIAKTHKELQRDVAQLAASALINEHVDVQKKSLDIIDTYGDRSDPEILRILELNQDVVVPSLQSRLSAWLNIPDSQNDSISEQLLPPQASLSVCTIIAPIATVDELIGRFLFILENPDLPIEIERVLDGLARLGCQKSSTFEKDVSPLRKRAQTHLKRGYEKWLPHALSILALSYTEQKNHFPIISPWPENVIMMNLLRNHLEYVATIIDSGKSLPLICMPTHGRAFIYPNELLERYKSLRESNHVAPIGELVLALLRMDTRSDQLLPPYDASKTDEFIDALYFAMGHEVSIGNTMALWIAAARVRNKRTDCPEVIKRFGDQGPDAGHAARNTFWVTSRTNEPYTWYFLKLSCEPKAGKQIPNNHLSVLLYADDENTFSSSVCGEQIGIVRWASTIQPGNLESYFFQGARHIDMGTEVQWHMIGYFEPLLEADVPMDEMATLLMCTGLGASEPGLKGIAEEVFILAIQDGRLNLQTTIDCMAKLLPTGFITVPRWTKSLVTVSSISGLHTSIVIQLIQGMLNHPLEEAPRDLGGLIELLYELLIKTNQSLTNPQAIEYLKRANVKGGKLGKYSKQLLALN